MKNPYTSHASGNAKKMRHDPLTIILVLIAVGLILSFVILVFHWFNNDRLYDDYVSDLSQSTVTVNESGLLLADIDGETCTLSVDTVYGLYQKLTYSKQLRHSSDMPDGDGITVEYGDGSVLRILYTDIDIASWTRNTGIFVSYTNPDGDEFSYITDRLQYDDLVSYLKEN